MERMDVFGSLGLIENDEVEKMKRMFMVQMSALDEIETKINIINREFKFIHEYNPIEHIKTRLKKPESIIEKMKRKGLDINFENAKNNIYDISGVRIICSFQDDIRKVADIIREQDDIKIIKVSDYVTSPKASGYQSYHMVVSVPVFLTDETIEAYVEIQIRTSAMDFWASIEHKLFYKYKGEVPEDLQLELKECAKLSNELDHKMYAIRKQLLD